LSQAYIIGIMPAGMGHDDHESQTRTTVPSASTVFVIMGTIADTTWRMFTPVIGLLILGIWLDNKTHHKPWFTLAGVLIGFAISIALVALQYRKMKTEYKEPTDKKS
jgi:hypothetical protein